MRRFLNLAGGFAQPVVSVLSGMLLTPLIISRLGMDAYSYWPLCGSLVMYANIITVSLTAGIRRETIYCLDRGDIDGARGVFNSGVALVGGIALALPLVGLGLVLNIGSLLVVLPGFESAVKTLLVFISLAVSTDLVSTCIFTGAYSSSHLYMEKVALAVGALLRLGVVALLFSCGFARLEILGVGALVASTVTLIISIWSCRRLMPKIRINPFVYASRINMRSLFGFGRWMFLVAAGTYIFQMLQYLLANRFLGVVSAGRLGVILQVAILFSIIASHCGFVMSRKLVALWANGSLEECGRIAAMYTGMVVFVMVGVAGLLSVNAEFLFMQWIGQCDPELAVGFRWMLLASAVVQPLSMVGTLLINAKRLRVNALSSVLMGPALFIACSIGRTQGIGLLGLVIAINGVLLARNILLIIDATRHCHFRAKSLLRDVVVGGGAIGGQVGAVGLLHQWVVIPGWRGVFLDSVLAFAIWVGVTLLFSRNARAGVLGLLNRSVVPVRVSRT